MSKPQEREIMNMCLSAYLTYAKSEGEYHDVGIDALRERV